MDKKTTTKVPQFEKIIKNYPALFQSQIKNDLQKIFGNQYQAAADSFLPQLLGLSISDYTRLMSHAHLRFTYSGLTSPAVGNIDLIKNWMAGTIETIYNSDINLAL